MAVAGLAGWQDLGAMPAGASSFSLMQRRVVGPELVGVRAGTAPGSTSLHSTGIMMRRKA